MCNWIERVEKFRILGWKSHAEDIHDYNSFDDPNRVNQKIEK
jgi:hypothetical protein